MRSLYFVTGASRGLGKALCQLALSEGHHVIGIARSKSTVQHDSYEHVTADLGETQELEKILSLFSKHASETYSSIHLVNNAGMIEPVGITGSMDTVDIQRSFNVNLTAAVALTNGFIRVFSKSTATKVVTNVTSGVAKFPKATWGVYSAAKAALNAFSQSLAVEYQDDTSMKVLCYEPGIIDTEMQAEIRSIPKGRFPDVERFQDFKKTGALQTPEHVAGVLMKILKSNRLGKDLYLSVQDHI